MSLSDEFKIIDSCTADALQQGDLIFAQGQYVEVHSIDDEDFVTIHGYSYTEDDTVSLDPVNFDHEFDLYGVA